MKMSDREIIETLMRTKEKTLYLVTKTPKSSLKCLVKLIKQMKMENLFKVNYEKNTLEYFCNRCTLYVTTTSVGVRSEE